jgi:hypothetical protein
MRKVLFSVIGLVVLFGLIQLIPYGHNHTNPSVVAEPQWDTPQTRELTARACYDCHSNATVWRWYSSIAPASWLIQHDVEDGRRRRPGTTCPCIRPPSSPPPRPRPW